MSSLFGGGPAAPDTSKQEKRLADQEKALAAKEAAQAKQLASRRRASAGGSTSKTLFQQVLGTDEAIGKQTKLGG